MGIVATMLQVLEDLDFAHKLVAPRMGRMAGLLHPDKRKNAALLWIAPDMVDLLRHAAKTLPAYPFQPSVLPWPKAVCVAGAPLMDIREPSLIDPPDAERHSGAHPVTILLWHPLAENEMEVPISGACMVTACTRHNVRWSVPTVPIVTAPLIPGKMWDEGRPEDDRSDAMSQHDAQEFARVCCTLWLLLQQKVAVKRRAWPERAERRRWERESDRPIPEVTVVELRKPISVNPEDRNAEPVDWSHRWIVDGHWRNQYHPSTGEHTPTWIAPYVKGPEDKPLVVKKKINAWVR